MGSPQVMRHGETVEIVIEFPRHKWDAAQAIKEEIDTQTGRVLTFLRKGFTVDQWDAVHLLGVGRLSARIYDIRNKGLLDDNEAIVPVEDYDGYQPYYLKDLSLFSGGESNERPS